MYLTYLGSSNMPKAAEARQSLGNGNSIYMDSIVGTEDAIVSRMDGWMDGWTSSNTPASMHKNYLESAILRVMRYSNRV